MIGVAVQQQLCAPPEMQNRLGDRPRGGANHPIATSQAISFARFATRLAISEQLARLILVEPVADHHSPTMPENSPIYLATRGVLALAQADLT